MTIDPVTLEVFGSRFASIAEEMGIALQRTGCSPNIKERRDYSCAVFDAAGDMIAQAAHIPVHLGSMPLSARAAIDAVPMGPGDAVILNDPYAGGTHLPDITVVSPVFLPGESSPRFYVANRAHHADVGGDAPGSMPIATHIDQEGIRIAPRKLAVAGRLERGFLDDFLSRVRTPEEREGDLAAQLAANHVGGARLLALCAEHGAGPVGEASAALLDYAERMTRTAIKRIPPGHYAFEDVLDDDGCGTTAIPIRVAVEAPGDGTLSIDFTGSAPQVPGPLNAVYAVTVSACFYVLRAMVDVEIPANAGIARAMRVIAPEETLVNARPPAAVNAGNVETSQRIVDVLLGALAHALPERVPAASCGSMNNLAIGGEDPRTGRAYAYYETIAGGAGASADLPGAHAVHTHMTNTRNTPVEALEHAYPFRVRRYAVREGSGGAGAQPGGDGVERELELLAPATVTLIGERRTSRPWGLAGGDGGAPGEDRLRSADGRERPLPAKTTVELPAGDVLVVHTPGGGGWGSPGR